MKRSKRYQNAVQLLEKEKVYSLKEAVELLKQMPRVKFDETLEVSCKLGADPQKSDQMVRGYVVLPHGTGKKVKVLVICEPEKEYLARKAGAMYVGGQELIEKISKENWFDFDVCVATPAMMRFVSRIGKLLGPRGLMPSPKTGTVTDNVEAIVKESLAGKVDFRMDKFGCIAVGCGKISFPTEHLVENVNAFIHALEAARPPAVKGEFIKSIYLSTTMSPAVKVKI